MLSSVQCAVTASRMAENGTERDFVCMKSGSGTKLAICMLFFPPVILDVQSVESFQSCGGFGADTSSQSGRVPS